MDKTKVFQTQENFILSIEDSSGPGWAHSPGTSLFQGNWTFCEVLLSHRCITFYQTSCWASEKAASSNYRDTKTTTHRQTDYSRLHLLKYYKTENFSEKLDLSAFLLKTNQNDLWSANKICKKKIYMHSSYYLFWSYLICTNRNN